MKTMFSYLRGDKVIWMITLVLILCSFVSVYSFTPILTQGGLGTEGFLLKHVVMVLSGLVLMFYAHNVSFKYYSKISQLGIWAAIILLFVTLIAGVNINSAGRWLVIPIINQKFQTSDFAKIMLLIYVARMLSVNRDKLHSFKEGVLPILIPVVLVCGLILPENFSTAAMLFGLCLLMMFIGRVPIKHLALIVGVCVAALGLIGLLAIENPELLPRLDTWINRVTNFQEDDHRQQWQINNAMMAIDNGGMFGKGPGNGQLKHILPQAYADFVFASFIEEFGFIGGAFLLMLYLILLYRVVRIASLCEKNFGSLMAIGLCLNLVFMAFVNMAVCTRLVPITGQNMPLISMGGTSTWFTCISLGIILSVSRSSEPEESKDKSKNNLNTATESGKEEGGTYAAT